MRGMNSASVDLVCLDPPFNSRNDYAAAAGSRAEGMGFQDTWSREDVDPAWLDLIEAKHPSVWQVLRAAALESDRAYLAYMAVRLLEVSRLLKRTGSLYLHCDPTMSHYLKLVLDAIFGRQRFLNEIVWSYGLGGSSKRAYSRKHDIILFYSVSKEYTFTKPQVSSSSARMKGAPKGMLDVWTDVPALNNMARERTGYPKQKPLALLRRIVAASSREGDLVLDPFSGCATALVAAEELSRNWAGIDVDRRAHRLLLARMRELTEPVLTIEHRTDAPRRTDLEGPVAKNTSHMVNCLLEEQRTRCFGCRRDGLQGELEPVHIIDTEQGGSRQLDNLMLLCPICKRARSARSKDYFLARLSDPDGTHFA